MLMVFANPAAAALAARYQGRPRVARQAPPEPAKIEIPAALPSAVTAPAAANEKGK
jgi:hypothetical protein